MSLIMRKLLLLIGALLLFPVQPSPAAEVNISLPRQFGFFVGDLVEEIVEIRTTSDVALQDASLPHPGPLTTFLELRSVLTEKVSEQSGLLWRLHLSYQNFYVALDVRELVIPEFSLTFFENGAPTVVTVPSSKFLVAPLREIAPEKRENAVDYVLPNQGALFVDESIPRRTTIIFTLAALIAILIFLRDRAFWPFHERKSRAFAAAVRRIRALTRTASGAELYRQSCVELHRSIDQTAGRAVLYEDISDFLASRPQYAPAGDLLRKFFAGSRAAFFADYAESNLQPREILDVARRLEVLERRA